MSSVASLAAPGAAPAAAAEAALGVRIRAVVVKLETVLEVGVEGFEDLDAGLAAPAAAFAPPAPAAPLDFAPTAPSPSLCLVAGSSSSRSDASVSMDDIARDESVERSVESERSLSEAPTA